MPKRIFTEDLFPTKEKDEVVELIFEKRKKLIVNLSLMVIYALLLIASLFIV
jgi:hypothetical protein